jgi:hypothetical protein
MLHKRVGGTEPPPLTLFSFKLSEVQDTIPWRFPMDKLITVCEFLKIEVPAASSVLHHILQYFCNEVDSNPTEIAKKILDSFAGSVDTPMEDFITSEYEQEIELTCELCGKPLYEQLWQDGRHVECSAVYAEIEASGHGDW